MLVRLSDGTPFRCALETWLEKHKIASAVIVNGMGMMSDVQLQYYEKGKYKTRLFKKPMELLSLQGNISLKDGKPFAHIHTVLADEKGKAFGGHLKDATVRVTNEIFLLTLDEQMRRGADNKLL